MARQDLVTAFLQAQEAAQKAEDERNQARSSRRESLQRERTVRLGLNQGESMKRFKGYFLTSPGDKFSREIRNIYRFGCSRNVFGTVGFRCMDPESYILKGSDKKNPEKGITEAQKNKLKNFINLFREVDDSKKVQSVTAQSDDVYFQRLSYFDIFYMYFTEGVDEPGVYLATTKSRNFERSKREWLQATKAAYSRFKEAGDQMYNALVLGMVDNTQPKNDQFIIEITQEAGYKFKLNTETVNPPFEIPAADLATLEDLDEKYISRYSIDEEELDKNIAILNSLLGKIQSLEGRSQVAADLGDVFKD